MKIAIAGVNIDKVSKKKAVLRIEDFLKEGQHYIATIYSELIVTAQKDEEFRTILNKADLAVADGAGILWAGKLSQISNLKSQTFKILGSIFYLFCIIFWPAAIKKVFPERISGVDLMKDVIGLCAQKKFSVFFLGAKKGVAKDAAIKLKETYQNLEIAGYFSGSKEEREDKVLTAIINQKSPDILFVAFGSPHQEKWISRNLPHLQSVKLAMGVGGSFDYISGAKKRAPKIFQNLGLEWFWRFIKEPSRWQRIINAIIIFPYLVIKNKINEH